MKREFYMRTILIGLLFLFSCETEKKRENSAFFINSQEGGVLSLKENSGEIDVFMPQWLFVKNSEGALYSFEPDTQAEVVEWIRQHRPEMSIVPMLVNYDQKEDRFNGEQLTVLLSRPESRARLIKEALEYILENKFQGINIDFESLNKEAYPHMVVFMKELQAAFHPNGLKVSIDLLMSDDELPWKELSDASDLIVLMAYDQHYLLSPPGPIASIEWYKEQLEKRLKELEAKKVAVAMGNYGYEWVVKKPTLNRHLTVVEATDQAKLQGVEVKLDPKSQSPHYSYTDPEGNLHEVWYQDATTANLQRSLAEKMGITQFALWVLGKEDREYWNLSE